MEFAGAFVIIVIGVAAVLFRKAYARFIMSFAYRIPAAHKHEDTVILGISWIALIFGLAFLAYGLVLSIHIASVLSQTT